MNNAIKKVVFNYQGVRRKSGDVTEQSKDQGVAFDKGLYRKEVSRIASLANKRIRRLEKNDFTDSPAYQALVKDGNKPQFSVKGKSFNELQSELSRMLKFVNSDTSTMRGLTSTLKTMATNTGIKYKNITDLKSQAAKFFELSSKVEQYLRTVDDMASAIGYNQIWEVINTYTKDNSIKLDSAETDIDSLITVVTDLLKNADDESAIHDFDMKNDWVFLT